MEQNLRRILYSWKHMQGDMTVSAVMVQPLCIRDTGFGIREEADIAKTDEKSDVVSRHFHIQIKDEADVEKIKMPQVSHDAARTEQEYQKRCEIFDGVLPVRKSGVGGFWFAPWDDLVRWTGVQEILMDMALRPKYVHMLIDQLVTSWLHRLDQYVAQGLLARPCDQLWGVGAAQIFSEVSPKMHEEFALKYEARWFSRFGKNYYGCCEPLHHKVDIIRKNIPRLRKISMSPWVDFDKAVENVGDKLIFAWKPNPAVLAADKWDPDYVRKDLQEKLHKARNCIVEIHMKDISTVRYQPQRLWEWARIASEVTEKYL
jgi:uroporphyrinogen-III decarboxylase